VVVANRCDAVGSIDPSLAQAMLGAHLDHLIPYAAKLTDLAEIKGVPFVISDPKSEPARRITELARSLLSAPAPVQ
jgi:Flp pilus assembly CpaE family ATPase